LHLLLAQSAGKQAIQQSEDAQQQLARLLLTRRQQAAGRGQVLHRRQMQTQQTGATAVRTASSGSSSTADVLGQQLGTQVQQSQVMWLSGVCWASVKPLTTRMMLANHLLVLRVAGAVMVATTAAAAGAAGVCTTNRHNQMLGTATLS
jgi:hypothetical protein